MRGFTLIEMLMYLALFSLLLTGLLSSFMLLHESAAHTAATALLISEGNHLVTKLEADLEAATGPVHYDGVRIAIPIRNEAVTYQVKDGALVREYQALSSPLNQVPTTVDALDTDLNSDRMRFHITLSTHTSHGAHMTRTFSGGTALYRQ